MVPVTDRSDQVTLREGFRVLARAVREEPVMFGVAVAGSALYGVMTGLSATVIGRVTDEVIVPAFRQGRTTTAALALAALAIVGVSVLKATGIVVRRFYAGVMQYRLQASYRRQVTHWVLSAKQEATRERRLTQLIDDSAAGRLVPPMRYGEIPKWAERAAEAARAAASESKHP